MKILHTVAPAAFGGLEEVVLLLARGLQERGHAVTVVGVFTGDDGSGHPFADRMSDLDASFRPIILPPRRYFRELSEVKDVMCAKDPDVVHTHGYRPDVLHRFAARRCEKPIVTTLHGFTGGGFKNRLYEWLQLRSVRTFDAVVAVSEPMRRSLLERGFPPGRVHAVRNAWTPRAEPLPRNVARSELDLPDRGFHVGWVGRLSHEKGPDVLMEALKLLADTEMSASFIGGGAKEAVLRAEVERSDELDVRFHGVVPEAGRLLGAFDVFVLSSRTEGTPIVLFEALSAGVPVIATSVGGVPDVVNEGCALLIEPDDPGALAEALRRVRDDRESARRRARRARERLDREFAVEPWIARYETLYRQVSAGHPADPISSD